MANPCTNAKSIAALQQQLQALQSQVGGIGLTTTTAPLYEYRDVWAEEGGALNAGAAEWSFGNGATGFMGLPIDTGWEVIAMAFHADTYPATATVQIDLMNYATPSNAAANTIASISLANSTDGSGGTGNAYKYENFATPIAIPDNALLGFITRVQTGTISDSRVYARLRRQVGDYVTAVTL